MTLLFSITIFLGAALLFLVQPMVGKMILPRLGGSPAVWNTCLVFFQAALLAGYLYAYLLDRVKNRAVQIAVHMFVLLLPALTLPLVLPSGWQPAPGESQSLAILRVLTVMVALPFCVVATTGPLLQRWYSLTGAKGAKDPYFLYAASNAGSLLGLWCYPLVVERTLPLKEQAWLWTGGYVVYAVLTLACGVSVLMSRASAVAAREESEAQPATSADWGQRVKWLVLAMVPSSLCVGATQYVSTDVAAIPFLWVLPLSLYLLTFVIAFSRWRVPVLVSGAGLLICAVGAGQVQLTMIYAPIGLVMTLHMGLLFFGSLVCHTQLAAARPPTRYLTQYYLLISLGGVLGGSFNALLAPVIFDALWEYPIAIVAACALIPVPREFAAPVRRMVRVAVVMATVVAAGLLTAHILGKNYTAEILHRERTFFGSHLVERDSKTGFYHTLRHGTTIHGVQRMTPEEEQRVPRSYFHRRSPIGWIFDVSQDDAFFTQLADARLKRDGTVLKRPHFKRVAIIGMGTGSLLAYAQKGDQYTVYEIDPAVDHIARNPEWFTFVSKCEGTVTTVLGDGRLKMAEAPDGSYDLIILDAFTSDAIPYHLLTKEALQLYLKKLAPGGVVALHVSNRHLNLRPVIGAGAAAIGATAIAWETGVTEAEQKQAMSGSVWCAVARDVDDILAFDQPGTWVLLEPRPGFRVWTDDYSNLLDPEVWIKR